MRSKRHSSYMYAQGTKLCHRGPTETVLKVLLGCVMLMLFRSYFGVTKMLVYSHDANGNHVCGLAHMASVYVLYVCVQYKVAIHWRKKNQLLEVSLTFLYQGNDSAWKERKVLYDKLRESDKKWHSALLSFCLQNIAVTRFFSLRGDFFNFSSNSDCVRKASQSRSKTFFFSNNMSGNTHWD